MYQIAYIGRWETLPETAAAICDHDTPKLEALLQGGLDLDVPIQLSEYIKLMPLEIAVFRNDVPMIHFLLEHGADPGLARGTAPAAHRRPLLWARGGGALCWTGRKTQLEAERAGLPGSTLGKAPGEYPGAGASWDHSGQVWRRGIPGRCVRGQHQTCPAASGKRGRHQLPQAGHGVSERPHRCHRSGSA